MTWRSWRKYRMKTKTAFLISEVCAPWVTNLWFFLVLGATSHAWPAAITAILGTSIMPMAAIRVLTLIGKAEGRHVQKREQRYIVFAAIFALLGAALAGLWHLHTPRIIWVSVLSAVMFIATFAVVTRLWCKASIHTGLWVCVTISSLNSLASMVGGAGCSPSYWLVAGRAKRPFVGRGWRRYHRRGSGDGSVLSTLSNVVDRTSLKPREAVGNHNGASIRAGIRGSADSPLPPHSPLHTSPTT